ncbi:hypothetical protein [Yersinia aldovae]|nr:hypothetical protein [Yersinia aldovae]
MKKQRVSILLGWFFCGAIALSISQTARADDAAEQPVYFCITCYYPFVWF